MTAFEPKWESRTSGGDDTMLNGIRIYYDETPSYKIEAVRYTKIPSMSEITNTASTTRVTQPSQDNLNNYPITKTWRS